MPRLHQRPAWKALEAHAHEVREVRVADLFAQDPARAQEFSIAACGLLFDYSKNPLSRQTRRLLVALAEDASLPAQITAMFEGKRINVTEKRAVLHTALRNR
ncbi:MAG TPA: glucose-6-phosphate isomerase, partial [Burkholderiales bacterium]|nr:glucose-6-phosphate isomerase [Burkholderiales bacterium]